MMLDITGSHGRRRSSTDLKDAAKDLVNIVVWDDQSKYTSKVAHRAVLRGHPPADDHRVDQGGTGTPA